MRNTVIVLAVVVVVLLGIFMFAGKGPTAKVGSVITVHYVGTLENGTKFDASLDHGGPLRFSLGQGYVIKGWEEGVMGMKVGEKKHLVIPPEKAYGDQQVGPIPPKSTLIFDVEMLKIDPAEAQPVQPYFVLPQAQAPTMTTEQATTTTEAPAKTDTTAAPKK